MAGDWIKMRCDLLEDPSVIGIASDLGLEEFSVVGRLHHLWSWANRQTVIGNAPSVTKKWIDRYMNCEGFADAMVKHGWLIANDTGIIFPKFDRHNGQPAKRRALTAERVSRSRADKCNATSVTQALPEKRREEKSIEEPPNPPPAGGDDDYAWALAWMRTKYRNPSEMCASSPQGPFSRFLGLVKQFGREAAAQVVLEVQADPTVGNPTAYAKTVLENRKARDALEAQDSPEAIHRRSEEAIKLMRLKHA